MADELRGLRADQQNETGDGIATNAEANAAAADQIVEGLADAVGVVVRKIGNYKKT